MRKASLGSVCEIEMGQAPKGRSYNSTRNGYPLLAGAGDFGEEFPIPSKFTSEPTKISRVDDILVCIRASIGDLNWSDMQYCLGRGVAGLRPKGANLDRRYLWRWLSFARPELEKRGRGSTFKQVARQDISDLEIPLPAGLGDQRRIAAILDKADAVRRKREEVRDLANGLVTSIFHDMFEMQQWSSEPLSDVVAEGTIVTYGIVQAGPEYPNGIPYIRTGDIKNGHIEVSGLSRTSPVIAAKFKRSTVSSGDIVMSIRATVGTTAVVPPEIDGANLTQGTARIAPGSKVTPEYLLSFLRSQKCQQWIQEQVKGATFREITLARLRELPVPLPPIESQKVFAARARAIADLKSKLDQDYESAVTLFHSLAQRAFRGEL